MPGRTEDPCKNIGRPHLPRRDGADGRIRRPSHVGCSNGSAVRRHCGPGHLHHRAANRDPDRDGVSQMKATWLCRIAAALALACALTARQATAQTSLTIYNDGRVLVRQSVSAKLPKGASSQRLALGVLDPATVFSLDSSVTLQRVSYDGAVDEASVLRRSVGKRLVFRLSEPRDTVSALVLGVDPLRLQLPDGRISFSPPGLALYRSDVVVVQPTVTLAVNSARGQDQMRLGYFTSGASWQASYQVVLGREDARVTGMAVLPSETLRAEDAEVQLLAGEVSQAQPKSP